jgi:FkbM family methyltransferase
MKKTIYNYLKLLNRLLKIFGLRIQKRRPSFDELIPKLIDSKKPVIFDVGANKGQSIFRFKNIFKDSKIHAFEPIPKLYKHIKDNNKFNDVFLVNKALGKNEIVSELYLNNLGNYGAMSSFKKLRKNSAYVEQYKIFNKNWNEINDNSVSVKTTTLDKYVKSKKIKSIDYLKIDVQGWESEVLKGAYDSLKKGIIKNIELEFIIADAYNGTASISDFDTILSKNKYKIIAINNYGDTITDKNFSIDIIYSKEFD